MALGYRHIRVQAAVPGLATYGASRTGKSVGGPEEQSGPTRPGDIWDSAPYVRMWAATGLLAPIMLPFAA